MKLSALKTIGVVALLTLIMVAGRSSAGSGAEDGQNTSRPAQSSTPGLEAARIPAWGALVLQLRDGERVVGVLVRLGELSEEEYGTRYARWRDSSATTLRLPRLADRVVVHAHLSLASPVEGAFVAFTHDGVRVRYGSVTRDWKYGDILRLSIVGHGEITGPRLIAIRLGRGLPLITLLELETRMGPSVIPVDEIQWIKPLSTSAMRPAFRASFSGLRPGEWVEVLLNDGRTFAGGYAGVTWGRYEAYRRHLASWPDSGEAALRLPTLGRPVKVTIGGRVPRGGTGDLVAFTHAGVAIGPDRRIWTYGEIDELKSDDGVVISGAQLLALRRSGLLPIIGELQLDTDLGRESVPLGDVAFVSGSLGLQELGAAVAGVVAVIIGVKVLEGELEDLGQGLKEGSKGLGDFLRVIGSP